MFRSWYKRNPMDDQKNSLNKKIDFRFVLTRLMKYCAYQERSTGEVRKQMAKYGLGPEEEEKLIRQLIEERFIDDLRFATSYASGKLRNNQWGRNRIRLGLREKGVDEGKTEKALQIFEPCLYQEVMRGLIQKKDRQVRDENEYVRRNKIARFLIGKGFEPDLVWDMIREEI